MTEHTSGTTALSPWWRRAWVWCTSWRLALYREPVTIQIPPLSDEDLVKLRAYLRTAPAFVLPAEPDTLSNRHLRDIRDLERYPPRRRGSWRDTVNGGA